MSKASELHKLIEAAKEEVASSGSFRKSPFEGTFATPALDRLVEVISTTDAIFYLSVSEERLEV